MKRAREFDNILDQCLERILKGDSIERCLAEYPEFAGELKPLLETAHAAKQATAIKPRTEYRERARREFQSAVHDTIEKRARRSLFNWQPQWATVVASALVVILLGGGGTVAAASSSMPDETLYPVKIATENVRIALTPTALGKTDLYLKLTEKRMAEIEKMAERGNPQHIEATAELLNKHLVAVASLRAPQAAATAGALMAPATQMATLEKSLAEPPATDTAVPAPPAAVTARGFAPPVVPAPTTSPMRTKIFSDNNTANKDLWETREFNKLDRETRIKIIITRRAIENPKALREMLKRAPDSVRPALERAIALSEEGYRNALKSMDKGDRENEDKDDED